VQDARPSTSNAMKQNQSAAPVELVVQNVRDMALNFGGRTNTKSWGRDLVAVDGEFLVLSPRPQAQTAHGTHLCPKNRL